ncbi:MAG TPA: hypothetical protein VKH42_14920 [Vicinamibacterales bacterium]|nr:hypothetical protein [Vicinamibacterales bacterium]
MGRIRDDVANNRPMIDAAPAKLRAPGMVHASVAGRSGGPMGNIKLNGNLSS